MTRCISKLEVTNAPSFLGLFGVKKLTAFSDKRILEENVVIFSLFISSLIYDGQNSLVFPHFTLFVTCKM